jgi:predicted short-subunit dehydrogenase-like oxidoreductase (DUF2520 family)
MMHHILGVMDESDPRDAITGPAARGDLKAIQKHIEALGECAPETLKLYGDMTERIQSIVNNEKS